MAAARLFGMTEEIWERHANPWSGWTRIATLPLLLAAVWSVEWIGWGAVPVIAIVLVWAWLNPRLFPKPRTTDLWISRAVLGERLWVNRGALAIPPRHRAIPRALSVLAGLGGALALGGAIGNAIWPTVLGAVLVYAGKLWFLDRMVWLYEDLKDTDPRYRDWLY